MRITHVVSVMHDQLPLIYFEAAIKTHMKTLIKIVIQTTLKLFSNKQTLMLTSFTVAFIHSGINTRREGLPII